MADRDSGDRGRRDRVGHDLGGGPALTAGTDHLLPASVRRLAGSTAFWLGSVVTFVLVGTLAGAHGYAPGIPCLFRATFRVPCPGCGLTRSLEALWRGDLGESLRMHPLGPLVFALLIGLAAGCAAYAALPAARPALRRLGVRVQHPRVMRWALTALLATWLARIALAVAGVVGFPGS